MEAQTSTPTPSAPETKEESSILNNPWLWIAGAAGVLYFSSRKTEKPSEVVGGCQTSAPVKEPPAA